MGKALKRLDKDEPPAYVDEERRVLAEEHPCPGGSEHVLEFRLVVSSPFSEHEVVNGPTCELEGKLCTQEDECQSGVGVGGLTPAQVPNRKEQEVGEERHSQDLGPELEALDDRQFCFRDALRTLRHFIDKVQRERES